MWSVTTSQAVTSTQLFAEVSLSELEICRGSHLTKVLELVSSLAANPIKNLTLNEHSAPSIFSFSRYLSAKYE